MTSITLSNETKAALAELKPADLTWDDYLHLLLESLEPSRFEDRLRARTDVLHRDAVERAKRRVLAARRPSVDEVRRQLAPHVQRLRSEFKVRALWVFGSVARGDARPDSDIDVLVAYDETPGLNGLVGLEVFLENVLGRKVDLGTRLKRDVREQVEREMVRVA